MADDAIADLLRFIRADARAPGQASAPSRPPAPEIATPGAREPRCDGASEGDGDGGDGGDPLDLWGGDGVPDFLSSAPIAVAPAKPLQRDDSGLLADEVASPRRAEAARLALAVAGCELSTLIERLEGQGQLHDVDGEAAWVVLRAVVAASGEAIAQPHGGLCGLLTRAVGCPDLALAALAFDAAARVNASSVQQAIAAQLRDRAPTLGFDGVERALASLGALGDGRCVRTMEEALLRQAAVLTEHQAWRARHIVQLIRRDHRR